MKIFIENIGDNTYKIFEQMAIATGFRFIGNYESYFGLDCFKDHVKDLLKIETDHNVKLNKTMIFNKEYKLYGEANNTCHNCGKTCVNKVRDHRHEENR